MKMHVTPTARRLLLAPPTRQLQRRSALTTLTRPRLFSSGSQWSSDSAWGSQARRGAPSRSSAFRGNGRGRGDFGRGRDRGDRRPPLTRTNDGEDVPQLAGEGVYGIHSVLQALESGHRQSHALYVREEASPAAAAGGKRPKKKSAADLQALARIQELAGARGVAVRATSKWMLNHITGDKPHQGVVLDAAPLQLQEFEPVEPSVYVDSERAPVILALDELHDPQNFGAILRSAHFLGCSAVLVSERNSAPLSPATSRASVGALEVLVANNKLLKARNLHEALAISGDMGWRVVGACSGPDPITSTKLSTDGQPTILVMGNEHRGLRKSIRQCCHEIATIPGQATDVDTRVDSLNVSVATAILMYELLHH